MESETKMMCPFRRKENGDFGCCYGRQCAAYFEDASYKISTINSTLRQEVFINARCKLLEHKDSTPYPAGYSLNQGIKDFRYCVNCNDTSSGKIN